MSEPTRRVTLKVDGVTYTAWTEVEVVRDLAETCGSFRIATDDLARTVASLPGSRNSSTGQPFAPFQKVEISLDGELILVGYIDAVAPSIDDRTVSVSIEGRDVVGDLIDCAAAPKGPVEYAKIKLEDLASRLCKPFGITVTAEVDTGDPIAKVSIDAAETVMSVLEKYARKRAVLIVSDGVGGLILTQSGKTRAPADIRFGENVLSAQGQFDGRRRFSDVFVKGQAGHAAGKRKSSAALDRTAQPLTAAPAGEADADKPSGRESRGVSIMGVAKDDEVGRWRPTVRSPRASGTLADAKKEAEWYVSCARGSGDTVDYEVGDWRATGTLWRPNQMTHVSDPYQDIDKDLLIAGVVYSYGQNGTRTRLRVTGREAYEALAEGDDDESTDLDGTAEALS